MQTKSVFIGTIQIIEIISKEIIIKNEQDALDVMSNVSADHIILHKHNFEKDFFDLSTRIAGEILQKFTNYHIKLAVIGDFKKYQSKSLKAFIYESNKQGDYLFSSSIDEVLKIWKKNYGHS